MEKVTRPASQARPARPTRADRLLAALMLVAVPFTGLSLAGQRSTTYDAQQNSYSGTMGRPYVAGPDPCRADCCMVTAPG